MFFAQARAEAAADGRWLLVNIQSHEEFPSHMLNRDTWVHETIESILRTTYLFWQRGHTSGDGRDYMNMYRLSEDDLPHIGIIDPRTGAKLLTLTVGYFVLFTHNPRKGAHRGEITVRV